MAPLDKFSVDFHCQPIVDILRLTNKENVRNARGPGNVYEEAITNPGANPKDMPVPLLDSKLLISNT